MHGIIIVAIVFGSILTLAGLLCGTVLVLVKMRRTNRGGAGTENSNDETTLIQEIYRGLEDMEKRIEALETILMDGDTRKGENS
jgi:phage shock protein B